MKSFFTTITFLLLLFSSLSLHAQITTSSQWTWMKGDSIKDVTGVYGTQGVASAANKPGSRYLSSSWTDKAGNLWLFGGGGYSSGSNGRLNDLWRYSPDTNQWTWMKGYNITEQPGVYGTIGTPALANTPGARFRSVTWTDTSGNLWLFGGAGYASSAASSGFLNDLWKYNPSTNQWTWMKGSNTVDQPAVYGTMGTPSAANTPGASYGGATSIDSAGNLWLFAGDIWKYNIAANQWTWMKAGNSTGVYGTMGVFAQSNNPPSRTHGHAWADTSGNLWLFGGSYYNDVWKYNIAINQWAWMKGANTSSQPGSYGTLGTPAESNNPRGRTNSFSWADTAGNFWVFGGIGYAANGFPGSLNDLWKYNPATNQWTWLKGDSTLNGFGVYGTMGVPSAANRPGARYAGVSWKDATGNFWVFGGISYTVGGSASYTNDLWKLSNNSVLPVTLSSVKAYQQNSGIIVEWKVENESGIKQYDIEKSSNSTTFIKVAVQPAKGNNSSTVNYAWQDLSPAEGNNFYRIQGIGIDGEIKYSPVMKVSTGKGRAAYEVYPNPVTDGTIQVQFINQVKGVYQVRLLNTSGQVILTEKIAHEAGSSTQTINPGSQLRKGYYILEVTAPDKSRQSINILY